MDKTFAVPMASLARIFSLFYPNPDDPERPRGPGGPVIRQPGSEVMLNPQPLPPVFRWSDLRWPSGPVPDPWRFGALGAAVVERLMVLYEQAKVAAGGESEHAAKGTGTLAMEAGDWICGNEPLRIPFPLWGIVFPPPPPPRPDEILPEEMLAFGASFYRASKAVADPLLQEAFASVADRITDTAFSRFETNTAPQ